MAGVWDKISITTDQGTVQQAITPLILSASRATDIPAFYSQWFMNRLEKGYIRWDNRFNPKAPVYISLEKVRLIVFWTKNPEPMLPYLKELDDRNIHYYFQFTLNDYEKENFEPNVPSLEKRIGIFKKLSELIGKEKVIWRFDPLLLSGQITVSDLLEKTAYIGEHLIKHTDKLVFSFADIFNYRNVKNNLLKGSDHFTPENVHLAEFTEEKKIAYAKGLQELLSQWKKVNPDFRAATCAENIDLSCYDIEHNKCIDDDLMIRLFPRDKELMDFIGYKPGLFGGNNFRSEKEKSCLKDKNQRLLCGCIYSKDIGSYNTCAHYCIYCYANSSVKLVGKNIQRINPHTDSLLPGEK